MPRSGVSPRVNTSALSWGQSKDMLVSTVTAHAAGRARFLARTDGIGRRLGVGIVYP